MSVSERLDTDPHPECKHQWRGLGASTVCEPPILHSVCFLCRTFRHAQKCDGYGGRFKPINRTWYSIEWAFGPWNWEEKAREAGALFPA